MGNFKYEDFKTIDGKLHKKVWNGYREATSSEKVTYSGYSLLIIVGLLLSFPYSGVKLIFELYFGKLKTSDIISGKTIYYFDLDESYTTSILFFTLISMFWMGHFIFYGKKYPRFLWYINWVFFCGFLTFCFCGFFGIDRWMLNN